MTGISPLEDATIEFITERVVAALRDELRALASAMIEARASRQLTVGEVADQLGVARSTVYAHWRQWGGYKLGPGDKAPIRFNESRLPRAPRTEPGDVGGDAASPRSARRRPLASCSTATRGPSGFVVVSVNRRQCAPPDDPALSTRNPLDREQERRRGRVPALAIPGRRGIRCRHRRYDGWSSAAALAHHHREVERQSIAEIASRPGRSPATIKAYFYDRLKVTKEPRRLTRSKAWNRSFTCLVNG